jgi:hypothetical protein
MQRGELSSSELVSLVEEVDVDSWVSEWGLASWLSSSAWPHRWEAVGPNVSQINQRNWHYEIQRICWIWSRGQNTHHVPRLMPCSILISSRITLLFFAWKPEIERYQFSKKGFLSFLARHSRSWLEGLLHDWTMSILNRAIPQHPVPMYYILGKTPPRRS